MSKGIGEDMYSAVKSRLHVYDKAAAGVAESRKDFDRILEKRRTALDRQHTAYNLLCEYFHDVNEARAFVANYEAEEKRREEEAKQEQKQKRDLLAESQAWEAIARWWEEPRKEKSNFGLCYSVTCFWNTKKLSTDVAGSMYKRIDAELIKRGTEHLTMKGALKLFYPPGENRAERAALARSFAYQALKEELGK